MSFDGQRLHRCRKAKGLSRDQLASLVGTSGRYLLHLETGYRDNPNYALAHRLARALGVAMERFAGDGHAVAFQERVCETVQRAFLDHPKVKRHVERNGWQAYIAYMDCEPPTYANVRDDLLPPWVPIMVDFLADDSSGPLSGPLSAWPESTDAQA